MNRSASSDQEISGPAYLRLVLLGALIGIPAALAAAVFLAFVNWLEDRLWDDLPDLLGYSSPPWFLVIALPALGACIVVAARHFLPGDGGHQPLEGIGGKPTPFRYGPSVVLAAIGTLAFGAVLGPEAPLIALGSVVGLMFAPLVRPGPKEEAVIGTAGSFSAVSALFDGPLVAGLNPRGERRFRRRSGSGPASRTSSPPPSASRLHQVRRLEQLLDQFSSAYRACKATAPPPGPARRSRRRDRGGCRHPLSASPRSSNVIDPRFRMPFLLIAAV